MSWFLLPAGIFAADYVVKDQAEKKLSEHPGKEALGRHILLRKYHNKGAALNALENKSEFLTGYTAGMTVCVFLTFFHLMGEKGNLLQKTGFGMLLGGASSNAWERITKHYVTDYFSFQVKWKKLRNVVFNISDFCIFIGTLLIILSNRHQKS